MNGSFCKNVTLICVDEASALETIALRGSLEYFGFVVSTHWIGNKNQFLELLQGKQRTEDVIVLVAHGTDGAFFLPDDSRIRFDALNIQLPGKIIISTGCETHGATAHFLDGGCSLYIAPSGSPEGNDACFFVTKLFWLLAQGKKWPDAFNASQKEMPEGSEFVLSAKTNQ